MVRIGILGTASIARRFFDRPLHGVTFDAVASRDGDRAQAFALQHRIPRSYGSYDLLLDDPSIDAVYIPLPQSLHTEYAIKAARAGKHILVEKPAALTVNELVKIASVLDEMNVFFMEGLMYRFKRIHRRVREIVDSNMLGDLRYVHFDWCFNIRTLQRSPFRLDPASGGGALYDLGIYGIDFLRYLTDKPIHVIDATMMLEKPAGVDMMTHISCTAGGVFGAITAGYTCDANAYTVCGEAGSVHVPGSVSGRVVDNTLHLHLLGGDQRTDEVFPAENPYAAEMEYFARCISEGRAPEPGIDNSIANLQVIENIIASARWVNPDGSKGQASM